MGSHLLRTGICGLAAATVCLSAASQATAAEPPPPAPTAAPTEAPPAEAPDAPPAAVPDENEAPEQPAEGEPAETEPEGEPTPAGPAATPEANPAEVLPPPPPEPAAAELAGEGTMSAAPAATAPAPAEAAPPGEGEGEPVDDDDSWISSVDVAAYLGLGVRLDDPPVFEVSQRVGALLGLGADLYFTPELALGVAFEHLEAGEEGGDLLRYGTMKLTRDLNSLWFRFRAYPLRNEDAGLFVAIGVAPTWQSADAAGAVWSSTLPGNSRSFECEGAGSVDAALRAGIGADVALAGGVRWITSANFDTYQLSDEPLDGCAPGAGTSGVFALRSGFAYGIPVP